MLHSHSSISQTLAVVVIVLIVVSGLVGYLLGGVSLLGSSTATTSSSTIGNSQSTTITQFQLVTSTIYLSRSTTTVTSTSYQYTTTLTTDQSNSLSDIEVANITTGEFPQQIAVNPVTNTVYATFWNGSTYLAVIDGSTNKIVTTLSNVSNSFPIVDSSTNRIYIGNQIIDGATNKILGSINSNLTFVALDQNDDILYADRQVALNGLNGTTILYEINGTTDSVIASQNFTGAMLGGFVFDEELRMLYAVECTNSFACSPSFVVAINGTDLSLDSKLQLNTIFFATTIDQETNTIYVTGLQDSLFVINGTNDELIATIPVMAYADEFQGIAVDPQAQEIFITGSPYCNNGFEECNSNVLYVLSSVNYGIFATFVSNSTESGPIYLQFNPANNETYMAFGFSNSILAVKVPVYWTGMLVP